ncbi:MAG: hypothetical protein LLF89_00770 [Spirochaetaceae bacterium]|nr:hypothetical protein [Spirochaetaceae bacterium]
MRSPLGIGGGFVGVIGAIGLIVAGVSAFIAVPAGMALAGLVGVIAHMAGAGPKQAIAARDAEIARAASEKLEQAEAGRNALSHMRIADPEVSSAVQLVVQSAGAYLEACRKENTHDPLADDAIAQARDLVDIYLKEQDEASTEKRYGLEDQDPFVDAKQRVVGGLKDKALVLRERRIQIDGGLPPVDQLSVREELK